MRRGNTDLFNIPGDCGRMIERRQFERYYVEIPAMLESISEQENRTIFLRTSNISAQGAFFTCSTGWGVGDRVKVSLALEFSEADGLHEVGQTVLITVSGLVLRIDYAGMAVAFDENYKIADVRSSGGLSTVTFQ